MENKETIKVRVGLMDILFGDQGDVKTCAIARAVKRQFPGKTVYVRHSTVSVRNGVSKTYELPAEASRFISRFDRRRFSVLPFTFEAPLAETE